MGTIDVPPPPRVAEDLSRALGKLDSIALAVIESTLAPAIDSGDPARVESALVEVDREVRGFDPEPAIRRAGKATNDYQRRFFFEAIRRTVSPRARLIGTDDGGPFLDLPDLDPADGPVIIVRPNPAPGELLDLFTAENTRLIKTLDGGIVDALRDQIVRAEVFGAGDPAELRERLLRQWRRKGVPSMITGPSGRTFHVRSHADLIARDQIAKLHAGLTRARFAATGVKRARWRDRDDSRVRPAHAELDGVEFDATTGVPGLGFPGEPISCRCYAVAEVSIAELKEARGLEILGL